jgi:hypothetical protein
MYKIPNWIDRAELDRPLFLTNIPYEFELLSIEDAISQSGSPMWKVVLKIFDEHGSNPTFKSTISLHEKMMWMVAHFMDSLGAIHMYDKNEVDFESLKHRIGQLIFKEDSFIGSDGTTKQTIKIKDFIKKENQIKLEKTKTFNDDIPF